jgi:hypothetical protein
MECPSDFLVTGTMGNTQNRDGKMTAAMMMVSVPARKKEVGWVTLGDTGSGSSLP